MTELTKCASTYHCPVQWGLGCFSECFLSMHEALRSIPSNTHAPYIVFKDISRAIVLPCLKLRSTKETTLQLETFLLCALQNGSHIPAQEASAPHVSRVPTSCTLTPEAQPPAHCSSSSPAHCTQGPRLSAPSPSPPSTQSTGCTAAGTQASEETFRRSSSCDSHLTDLPLLSPWRRENPLLPLAGK